MKRQRKTSGSLAALRAEAVSKGPLLYGSFILILLVPQLTAQDQRPANNPEFGEGFRAFKQKDWEATVVRMQAALGVWPEDGELTRTYGRWFEPYLPRYYLGVALLELGCYRQALDQLDATLLNVDEVKGARKHKERLESLKLECEQFLRQGISESNPECHRWDSGVDTMEGESSND